MADDALSSDANAGVGQLGGPTPASSAAPAEPDTTTTPEDGWEEYVIRSGDTLSGIARRAGTSVDELLAHNEEITDPNVIRAGATLRVPAGFDPGPAPAPSRRRSGNAAVQRPAAGAPAPAPRPPAGASAPAPRPGPEPARDPAAPGDPYPLLGGTYDPMGAGAADDVFFPAGGGRIPAS